MNRTCLECGNKLVGRTDKKFCGDYCRNAYNNRLNRDNTNMIRNVHNRLRKNYRVLEKMNPSGKTKILKKEMLQNGFDFTYFTSIYTTKKGNVYYFVYDQGYLLLSDNTTCVLVKREF